MADDDVWFVFTDSCLKRKSKNGFLGWKTKSGKENMGLLVFFVTHKQGYLQKVNEIIKMLF